MISIQTEELPKWHEDRHQDEKSFCKVTKLFCEKAHKVTEIVQPLRYYTEKQETRCYPVVRLKHPDPICLSSVR